MFLLDPNTFSLKSFQPLLSFPGLRSLVRFDLEVRVTDLTLNGDARLTVVRNFDDLTKLGKSESYEFMLNHKGDDKIAIFIDLNSDLTIEIKNESWNNLFVDFKETIEANVCEETLDVVGFVVGLINNTTFVNVVIFNGFVEFGNCGGNARDFGYFWDVGFGEGYIDGSGSWHFIT
ncbi:hypothetical protein Tco_0058723 [Tanacetum coccineum]